MTRPGRSPFTLLDIPPVWLVIFIALGALQARYVPLIEGNPLTDFLGLIAIITGLFLIFVAAAQLFVHRTTVIPRQRPTTLVVHGIFGLTRNPIYLGDTLVLTGLILRWDAFLSLVLVPLFMTLIQRRFILGEEQRNREEFGTAFDDYADRVRRWL